MVRTIYADMCLRLLTFLQAIYHLFEVKIFHHRCCHHWFKGAELRFGFQRMSNSLIQDLNRTFTDQDNPLCAKQGAGSPPPLGIYDVFRCANILPGNVFTLQLTQGRVLAVKELDFRVEYRTGKPAKYYSVQRPCFDLYSFFS